MKNISFKTAKNDIIAGIIVALVSIPISMGYAQIAGLPAAYGLYGSLLPVLVYAFTTSSPQFVFGVDATPAVLVGGTLAALGVTTGSDEAMRLVPAITLVVAAWLFNIQPYKSWQNSELHIHSGHGRFHKWDRNYYYTYAGA